MHKQWPKLFKNQILPLRKKSKVESWSLCFSYFKKNILYFHSAFKLTHLTCLWYCATKKSPCQGSQGIITLPCHCYIWGPLLQPFLCLAVLLTQPGSDPRADFLIWLQTCPVAMPRPCLVIAAGASPLLLSADLILSLTNWYNIITQHWPASSGVRRPGPRLRLATIAGSMLLTLPGIAELCGWQWCCCQVCWLLPQLPSLGAQPAPGAPWVHLCMLRLPNSRCLLHWAGSNGSIHWNLIKLRKKNHLNLSKGVSILRCLWD